jgi:circadian clock protein KaiB
MAAEGTNNKEWQFVLCLSGSKTRLSKRAIENLHDICEEHLTGRYSIQVIDIEEQPQIGIEKNVIASPTLIRELPEPVKRVIGDLSEREKALVSLQIKKTSS